ncbi:class C sortase [Ligilactobacillus pobuzihii]|uniref:Sortase family protein n=1 Tax=Ligilactobacillus pobuzihii TaxID=449659 RepID=A0A0R2LGK3_9LACO|nr:class C sortase [Ligilactobacillus pobuzihii]KRK09838.1 sortase family protein [Ligilactobacillus pobuzihii E100301 = KCTC 13174]KRO00678.1 sortase family protein [Ligilactobacillus pobuzihii]GEN48571.1 class C sortase [Ligilactobacillus pobuzihii]
MQGKKKVRRANKIWQILMLLLLLTGFGIALYPFYVGAVNNFIDQFRMQHLAGINNENAAQMRRENEKLSKAGIHIASDPFKGSTNKERVTLEKHIIGTVSVPKTKLHVPLFDKTSDTLLEYGVTVVQGTSYPIGGKSTHTVIAGHRGLASRKLFTDLNHVKKGNIFVIKVDHKNRAYKVNKIEVVKPNNTEVLKIEPGKDLATLLTCTPYMINSHRLLVTGYRVPYTKKIAKEAKKATNENNLQQLLILVGIIVLFVILIVGVIRLIHSFMLKKHVFDFTFTVVNESGVAVSGVKVQLLAKNGKKRAFRAGQEYAVISDDKGQITFTNLPGGLYAIQVGPEPAKKLVFGLKKLKQDQAKFYPRRHEERTFLDDGWKVKV